MPLSFLMRAALATLVVSLPLDWMGNLSALSWTPCPQHAFLCWPWQQVSELESILANLQTQIPFDDRHPKMLHKVLWSTTRHVIRTPILSIYPLAYIGYCDTRLDLMLEHSCNDESITSIFPDLPIQDWRTIPVVLCILDAEKAARMSCSGILSTSHNQLPILQGFMRVWDTYNYPPAMAIADRR